MAAVEGEGRSLSQVSVVSFLQASWLSTQLGPAAVTGTGGLSRDQCRNHNPAQLLFCPSVTLFRFTVYVWFATKTSSGREEDWRNDRTINNTDMHLAEN